MSTFLNNAKIKCASFTRTYGPMSTIQRARKYTTPELTVQDGNFGSLRCGEGLVGRGWWGDASPRSLLDQTRCKMVKWQLFAPRLFVGNLLLLLLTEIFLLREGFKDRTGQPCAIFPVRKYGKHKETTDIKGFWQLENMANRRKQQISRVFAH